MAMLLAWAWEAHGRRGGGEVQAGGGGDGRTFAAGVDGAFEIKHLETVF